MTTMLSFEEACELLKLNPADLPMVDHLTEFMQANIIAYYKLCICAKAEKQRFDNWTPNFYDRSILKGFPNFVIKATKEKPSGVGFELSTYGFTYACTRLGVRLCLPTDICDEFADAHTDLFEDFLLEK